MHRGKKLDWPDAFLIRLAGDICRTPTRILARIFEVSINVINQIKSEQYWRPPGGWGIPATPSPEELRSFLRSSRCPDFLNALFREKGDWLELENEEESSMGRERQRVLEGLASRLR